jgi:Domain of unknown function (DUF5122) beta-propeller
MRSWFTFLAMAALAVVGIGAASTLAWHPWSSGRGTEQVLVPSRQPVAAWTTDGEIHDVAQAGGKVFAAGTFTRISPWTGGLAATDTGRGLGVGGLPWIEGEVATVVADGSGGWYVGGEFDRSDGGRCSNLVRVLESGGLDPRFCAHLDGVRLQRKSPCTT